MQIDERFSFITAACGQQFQVLNEEGDGWNEWATAAAYQKHAAKCAKCKGAG